MLFDNCRNFLIYSEYLNKEFEKEYKEKVYII